MKNRSNNGRKIFLSGITLLLFGVMPASSIVAEKKSSSEGQRVSIRGHVFARVNYLTGYLRGGLGDRYEVFVFGLEPRLNHSESVSPVKIMYRFFKTEPALPESFFDSSKRFELLVVREPSCDETMQNLSYQKNTDETGKPLPSTYILHPLDGAPTNMLKPDSTLPCYVLRPERYKLLIHEKKP